MLWGLEGILEPAYAKKKREISLFSSDKLADFECFLSNRSSLPEVFTMEVEFGISMKSNKVHFNICKPPSCNFPPVVFRLKTILQKKTTLPTVFPAALR